MNIFPLAIPDNPADQLDRQCNANENVPPSGMIPWSQVKQYMKCPQRYWYRHRAGLSERGDRSYVRFKQALDRTLHEVASNALVEGALAAHLEEGYREQDLGTAGYAAVLRRSGHTIASQFCLRLKNLPSTRRIVVRPWVCLPFGNTIIGYQPAEVEYDSDTVVTARLHFLKPPAESHHERHEVALLYKAFNFTATVEFWYPLESLNPLICNLEERRPEVLPSNSRKDTLQKIVSKKLSEVQGAVVCLEAAEFMPKPDDHECRGCGFQYVCPASH